MQQTIWTIGHSNRTESDFLEILKEHGVRILVDIRTLPGSRAHPHFNQEAMMTSLPKEGIQYLHFPELGGRRKPRPDSTNTIWRNSSFRGYADYMETDEFRAGIEKLERLAKENRLAYMCSEAVWWRCHRALVSDFLKTRGWTVLHIQDTAKAKEHPYTSAARPVQGNLFYN